MNMNYTLEKVQRERSTETAVRCLDAHDIVKWIHKLEDAIFDFEETVEGQEQYINELKKIAILAVSSLGDSAETHYLIEKLNEMNITVP